MNYLTTGDIAKKLDVDRDAVSYVLRKLKISPIGLAGQVRIFPESALYTVRGHLKSKGMERGVCAKTEGQQQIIERR